MSYHIAYHVILRSKESPDEIDLKNEKLIHHISKFLKEKNCKEYCLGARYDQVNLLFALNPDIALNDFINELCNYAGDFIKNEIKITNFTQWNNDHIVFTHSTNFMRHIMDYIKADDEAYQEERRAREAEMYDQAKRGWLHDGNDPMFDDLLDIDFEDR